MCQFQNELHQFTWRELVFFTRIG